MFVTSHDLEFDAAIVAHDAALAERDLSIWVGAEPTFTNRHSQAPEWVNEALGPDKHAYACRVLSRLRDAQPGAIVLRTLGRQYAGESQPRWSLGIYARRDGQGIWHGPPDPLTTGDHGSHEQIAAFRAQLLVALNEHHWPAVGFDVDDRLAQRVVFRIDGETPQSDPAAEPLLAASSPHWHKIPVTGAVDALAARGDFLVKFGCDAAKHEEGACPSIEIPQFPGVDEFLTFVACVERAAQQAGLSALAWRGFPPPVDDRVAWTTLTPDPAVLEINQAPTPDVTRFLTESLVLYSAAKAEGLAPYRLQYTGVVSDSGGGGQFTLGGPNPARSPFFLSAQLLPRLVRYLNRHPTLSYWFAPTYIGSSSQSPRPDEGVRESFSELAIALDQLARAKNPEPGFIWESLNPFLADPTGNTHRSELNIEKLWNPYLPGRGCLGLVEFRAFRMARSPRRAASIAALLRAIAGMLSTEDPVPELTDWGNTLHDRFALPFFLREDLEQVLRDLDRAGLGLPAPIAQRLRDDPSRIIGQTEFAGCRLEITQALEFWPLLGDAASQESGGSRLVDASSSRIELALYSETADEQTLADWRLQVGGYIVPLREESGAQGPARVLGLRYRSFMPWRGLHPSIAAQGPIVLTLSHPQHDHCLRVTLHEWEPSGAAYPGVPDDFEDARQRRRARFVVEELSGDARPAGIHPPARALSDYCLDLRRLQAPTD